MGLPRVILDVMGRGCSAERRKLLLADSTIRTLLSAPSHVHVLLVSDIVPWLCQTMAEMQLNCAIQKNAMGTICNMSMQSATTCHAATLPGLIVLVIDELGTHNDSQILQELGVRTLALCLQNWRNVGGVIEKAGVIFMMRSIQRFGAMVRSIVEDVFSVILVFSCHNSERVYLQGAAQEHGGIARCTLDGMQQHDMALGVQTLALRVISKLIVGFSGMESRFHEQGGLAVVQRVMEVHDLDVASLKLALLIIQRCRVVIPPPTPPN